MENRKNNQAKEKRIHAGWLIDGHSDKVRENVTITVRQGHIVDISPFHQAPPATHDYSGATILPKLMDAHVHLVFSGTLDVRQRTAQLKQTPEQAFETIRTNLDAHRRYGVTAVRDGGDRLGAVLDYKLNQAGQLPVHVAATHWAWHAKGRYGRMIGRALPETAAPEHAVSASLAQSDHLKLILSGLNSLDRFGHHGAPQFSETALCAMVDTAHQAGRPVMVHANGETAVGMALSAGCDSIEHGYFMGEENLRRMAGEGICWVPTIIPMSALSSVTGLTDHQRAVAQRTCEHQLAQVQKALALGVIIVLGTDAGSQGVDHGIAVRQELELFLKAGMRPAAAVRCATGQAAQLLGLQGMGVLKIGDRAEMLVAKGTPEQLGASDLFLEP